VNAAKARILDHFASPRIEPGATPCLPSRQAMEALEADPRYQRLQERLEAAGFFAPVRGEYAVRIAAFVGVFAGAFAVLLAAPGWPVRLLAWAAIGFVLVQGCFLAHEAMHNAVSRRPAVRQAVGQFFDSFLVGFPFSYFCRSHELHHFHCNEESIDPDGQSALFSVFEASAHSKRGLGRLVTRFQHVLIPLLYPVWALAMQWDGLTYVLRNRRKTRLDQLALALHLLLWFGVAPLFIGFLPALVNYLGRSVFAGLYLGIVIPVNHVARPSLSAGTDLPFLDQQVACTRNLGDSPTMDFLFMGLNNHVEHHLFPWVPTSRLRRGRAVLRAFCTEEGLAYHEQSFATATADVLRHFARVARALPK
jgi:fatty acid desaturase